MNNRSRNDNGEYRRKRGDTKIETLKEVYPEFKNINGNTHLKTLRDKFKVDSLDDVLKILRKQ